MKRIAWWCIKIVCGIAVTFGTLGVVFAAALLFNLLTGRIEAGFHYPPVEVAAGFLVAGLFILVIGLKAPTWLDIDRLL